MVGYAVSASCSCCCNLSADSLLRSLLRVAHTRENAIVVTMLTVIESQSHRCQVMLRWVEEYGPNIALRLAWVNVLIITEVWSVAGCTVTPRNQRCRR